MLWKPIRKHIYYCLNPESNVHNLMIAADDLRDTIDTIEERILVGECEGKKPKAQATSWIRSAQSVRDESDKIKNGYEARRIHALGCSWNFFFNYSVSNSATKMHANADEIKKRAPENDGMFSSLPLVGRELPLPPYIVGQDEYKDKIVGSIKQGTTGTIGICGMGGSGKTTLLKQLNNFFSCAAETHEFDHVIYVEVSQQQNLETVQQNIASQLGIMLTQNKDATFRSASLYNFLKERSFLLLIDDLWQTLDLVKVGIPQGGRQLGPQNRQMIVITSRLQQVCYGMDGHCQMIVLQRLKFNEAWSLFESNAGIRITNNVQVKCHAESIVEKCGGLPLALKIVGQAMASKGTEHEWELAVNLLEQSQFHKVPDVENDLYSVLYISYDNLPDERTKQCFLFFAFASYGTSPTRSFWMGHGLLDEDDDIGNSNLRGYSVVACLKRACLLEGHPLGEKYLRMHDCIQDLALWITATKRANGSNKKWLVVSDQRKLIDPKEWSMAERIRLLHNKNVTIPNSCYCPHLLTLIMRQASQICMLTRLGSLESLYLLPTWICIVLILNNLQHLEQYCTNIHLDLSYTPIQSLPVEFRLLKKLRYLYLRYTRKLQTVPDGTISALSMLRVLDIHGSVFFTKVKARSYLEELESLTSLQLLRVTVVDFQSLRRIFNLSRVSLRDRIGTPPSFVPTYQQSKGTTSRSSGSELYEEFGEVDDRW
uniref:NB-ARC domain-containing protein n=1 Tax=Oryza nivara TaxID=4536 RepID=A0A0E0IHZ4_ORYNI